MKKQDYTSEKREIREPEWVKYPCPLNRLIDPPTSISPNQ